MNFQLSYFLFFFASLLEIIFRQGMGQIWWQEGPSEAQMQVLWSLYLS